MLLRLQLSLWVPVSQCELSCHSSIGPLAETVRGKHRNEQSLNPPKLICCLVGMIKYVWAETARKNTLRLFAPPRFYDWPNKSQTSEAQQSLNFTFLAPPALLLSL